MEQMPNKSLPCDTMLSEEEVTCVRRKALTSCLNVCNNRFTPFLPSILSPYNLFNNESTPTMCQVKGSQN